MQTKQRKQTQQIVPTQMFLSVFLSVFLSTFCLHTTVHAKNKKNLWVYTSIYKEFAAPIEAAFETQHPDIDVQIFQAGSEKIQAKVEAELLAQKPQADILLTSDPFWSTELDSRGLAFQQPGKKAIETNYYSLMVLIAHKDMPAKNRPTSFKDLTKPEYKSLIQSGSPLESGTTFSMVAYLVEKYGWDYFSQLKKNELAASGGNSTVIQKVESGEKKIGIVLLENALAARKRGSPIDIIYPTDGAIPIPSVQVILKNSKQTDSAVKFADFLLSTPGQQLLINGYMYSVNKKLAPPEGAIPLHLATKSSLVWTPQLLKKVGGQSKQIKKKFTELILE